MALSSVDWRQAKIYVDFAQQREGLEASGYCNYCMEYPAIHFPDADCAREQIDEATQTTIDYTRRPRFRACRHHFALCSTDNVHGKVSILSAKRRKLSSHWTIRRRFQF